MSHHAGMTKTTTMGTTERATKAADDTVVSVPGEPAPTSVSFLASLEDGWELWLVPRDKRGTMGAGRGSQSPEDAIRIGEALVAWGRARREGT